MNKKLEIVDIRIKHYETNYKDTSTSHVFLDKIQN